MTARLSDKTLVKIQAVSGLAFAMFLALHLANTVLASAGQETYNAFQRAARWYYQFPLVEVTAVLGAALAHMWAGVARILRRRRLHEENPRAAGLLAVLALGGNLFEVNTSAFPQIEAAYHKVMEFVSTDDDRIADAK